MPTKPTVLLFRLLRSPFFSLKGSSVVAETMTFGFYFQSPAAAASGDLLSEWCRRTPNEDIVTVHE